MLKQFVPFFKLYYQFRSVNLLSAMDVREHNIGVEAEYGAARCGLEAWNLRADNFEEFKGSPTPGLLFLAKLIYRFEL